MSVPNPYSALLYDGLVRKLDSLTSANDLTLALEEFALGQPASGRALDLCFGYAPIPPATPAQSDNLLILSRGICRVTGVNGNNQVILTALTPATASQPVNVLASLPMGVQVTDAYAWGSVFLTVPNPPPVSLTAPTIQVQLVCGGPTNTGQPLLACRDADAVTATSWLTDGTIPACSPPAGAVNSLEILRFVLSIDSYLSSSPQSGGVSIEIVDMRSPRGWGGFCEEMLAAYLTPAIITEYAQSQSATDAAGQAVYNLVNAWITLPSWTPTFQGYWRASSYPLPTRLKQYLDDTFGMTF